MTNNSKEHDKQKGFLIIDELPLGISPGFFLRYLISQENYLSNVFAKWLKPKGDDTGIGLQLAKHKYPDGKQVWLYCFPEAIDRGFGIEDFEAPVETVGFVVIVDTKRLSLLNEKVPEKHSAINWAKRYRLPIIVTVINSKNIKGNIERLSQLIDNSPDMPIIWCDGDIDYDCVHRTMSTIHSYI